MFSANGNQIRLFQKSPLSEGGQVKLCFYNNPPLRAAKLDFLFFIAHSPCVTKLNFFFKKVHLLRVAGFFFRTPHPPREGCCVEFFFLLTPIPRKWLDWIFFFENPTLDRGRVWFFIVWRVLYPFIFSWNFLPQFPKIFRNFLKIDYKAFIVCF